MNENRQFLRVKNNIEWGNVISTNLLVEAKVKKEVLLATRKQQTL